MKLEMDKTLRDAQKESGIVSKVKAAVFEKAEEMEEMVEEVREIGQQKYPPSIVVSDRGFD